MAFPAGTRNWIRRGCEHQSPIDHEQQGWCRQRCGRHGRKQQLFVSTCLSVNPGAGERHSLKPFGLSPLLLPGHKGWCLGGHPSRAGGARQPLLATMGKTWPPECLCGRLCQRTVGMLIGGISLLSCWQRRAATASLPWRQWSFWQWSQQHHTHTYNRVPA